MKITVNQLRKIIKEEVGRMVVGEGTDPVRRKINKVIMRFQDMLDKGTLPSELRNGVEQSIIDLETVREIPDEFEEPDYGTEEEELYMDDYTDEEPMYESRSRILRKR